VHVICIITLCSNTNSNAVSVKLAEMQFRLFLNMPLSSCKFKYNKRNSSCFFLVSLCYCLNQKELNKKVIHDLSSGQSWKRQMRFGSHENNLWFYLLVASLVAWWIFCLMGQNEMYDTQIQNELGFKVRENLQLTNTDKKPLPACQHYKHDNTHPYWLTAK